MNNQINQDEVKRVNQAIEKAIAGLKLKTFTVEAKVPVVDDNGVRFTVLGKPIQTVDTIEVPKEFVDGAKVLGFHKSQYMALFTYKEGRKMQLIGFKIGKDYAKCRVLDIKAKKVFRINALTVKKYIIQTESGFKPKSETLAPTKPNLNDKLKEAGLWIKGCQFLSNLEKQQLLGAKDKKGIANIAKLHKIVASKLK